MVETISEYILSIVKISNFFCITVLAIFCYICCVSGQLK